MLQKRIALLSFMLILCIGTAGISLDSEVAEPDFTEVVAEEKTELVYQRKEIAVSDKCFVDVAHISQFPELPSGCEITSAAMVLNFLGIATDKLDLINYLDMDSEYVVENGEVCRASYWEKFVGDPRSNCYGCSAPVIHKMLDKYLAEKGVSDRFRIYSFVGANVNDVYDELMRGNPVIVWATICMVEPYLLESWKIKGSYESIDWYAQEHCTVLTGFDNAAGTVSFSDPYSGYCTYSKELFELRMRQMNSQYVVIEEITE